MMQTVTFGTKNSYADFGLVLSSKEIGLPQAKLESVDVLGRDGKIDLTETLADDVKFGNRTLSFTFSLKDSFLSWAGVLSEVTNYLHGRKLQIRMDWDRNYYYEGRCVINEFKSSKSLAQIVIDCDCDPYKLEVNSTSSPWVWDTFSFVDGIIYINSIDVNGTVDANLINRRKVVSPTFTTTRAMTVEYEGVRYNLPIGATKVLEIRLKEGDNRVTFRGTGTVTIDYKRGSL